MSPKEKKESGTGSDNAVIPECSNRESTVHGSPTKTFGDDTKTRTATSCIDTQPPIEAGMFIASASLVCRSDEKAGIGQTIRALRKEKGISQEELARKAQVDRTTIARIECGIFKSVSMERLGSIAQAIGIDVKTLLSKAAPSADQVGLRGYLNQVAFALEYPEDGFRITSLIPKRREFFFGRIEIQPQRTILSAKLPHPDQIYVHLFDGKMLLTRFSKELLLKTGDCFLFPGGSDYELYNPDPMKALSALFVTYPSFLPV